jgi:hypothetical protein
MAHTQTSHEIRDTTTEEILKELRWQARLAELSERRAWRAEHLNDDDD